MSDTTTDSVTGKKSSPLSSHKQNERKQQVLTRKKPSQV